MQKRYKTEVTKLSHNNPSFCSVIMDSHNNNEIIYLAIEKARVAQDCRPIP